MIADSVAEARDAGVPEREIQRVVREETRLDDELTAPVLAGRLGVLAREARRASGRLSAGRAIFRDP